jgi:RNA polymerase sigma-70 factor (ECF subfamily)
MTDWPTIVSRHSSEVWQAAYRLLGDREEAADCLQETFLEALEISRRQKVRHWRGLLKRLCTCRAVDRLRRRLRRGETQADPAQWTAIACQGPGPVEEAQAAELARRLPLAVAQLPPQQASVFCLRCLEDLSYREIARQLDLKVSHVGVLLNRARANVRETLLADEPSAVVEGES